MLGNSRGQPRRTCREGPPESVSKKKLPGNESPAPGSFGLVLPFAFAMSSETSVPGWHRRRCARVAAVHLDLVNHLATSRTRFRDALSFFFISFTGHSSRKLNFVTAFVHRDAREFGLLLNL